MLYDLRATAAGPIHDRVQFRLWHQLRNRDPADRCVGNERNHGVAVTAEDHRLYVAHRDIERFGEERPIAGRVEHTRHAENPLAWKTGHFHRDIGHHVERVGNHDHDRVRGRRADLLGDLLDDPGIGVEQIVARHAGFARDAGGDYHDVRVASLFVAVGADHSAVESFDWRRLPLVESFPLRNPLHHIDHHYHARELFLRYALRGGRADIAGADDRNLIDHCWVV